MMKSFFKKLAFVMALAMVVSLAAPAGQTAFAADAFALTEKNGETKDTYTLAKVGDTLDLDFLNPTEGWNVRGNANYGWDWVSSAPAIADVDWTGLVTAYAEGEAVITGSTNGGDLATVKVIVGEVSAPEVEEPVVVEGFTAAMVSDSKAILTFADTTVKAADVKGKLGFYYYVAPSYDVPLPLIKEVADGTEAGTVVVTMFDGFLFEEGFVYGFTCTGEEAPAEFTCEIGTPAYLDLKIKDHDGTTVEANEEAPAYVFESVIYNEANVDITETVLNSGAYVVYTVAEDEDSRFYQPDDVSICFSEPAVATVEVGLYELDDNDEQVALVGPYNYYVNGVTPIPYTFEFQAPTWTMTTSYASNYDWSKANHKLAVGDMGYTLVAKLNDNKGDAADTMNTWYDNGTQQGADSWEGKGNLTFKSTNVAILYVTPEGDLVPNGQGTVDVLVYYQPEATEENDNPAKKLVGAFEIKVEKKRTVGTVSINNGTKTLSTVNVNSSNISNVTVTVKDTLGDVIPTGTEVLVECTNTNLSDDVDYLIINTDGTETTLDTDDDQKVTFTTNAEGKVSFKLVANATTLTTAGDSQTFYFKVTVGGKSETFNITAKSPKAVTSYSKVGLIYDCAKLKEDTNGVENLVLTVGLAGISNGVAAEKLVIAGAKDKAADHTVGSWYYSVSKDGEDITKSTAISAVDGNLQIKITQDDTEKATVAYKATANEVSNRDIKVIDLTHGAGKYTITIQKVAVNSSGNNYYQTINGNKGTYTVTNELPAIAPAAVKLAPTTTIDNIETAVKECFKFTIGNVTFDSADDEDYANYLISIDENFVEGGDVCFVKTVTFYKQIAGIDTPADDADDLFINCGTATVNDYFTIVEATE